MYRTSGEGVSLQADGIKDGVKTLFGEVRQGVDRIAPQELEWRECCVFFVVEVARVYLPMRPDVLSFVIKRY